MALLKLFRPLSLSVGLRYAFASSKRRFATFIALLSMIGIMLGVAALIVVISVMNGLEGELKDRLLSSVPHAVLTGSNDRIAMDYDLEKIKRIRGVQHIAPQISDDVMIQGSNGIYGATLYGVDPATCRYGGLRIISASYVRYTPFGRMPSQRMFNVSGTFSVGGMSASKMILANIEDVRKLVHMPKGYISGFRVWLKDPFTISDFIEQVKKIDPELEVKDWRIELGEFFQSVAQERTMMGLMLALITMVAVFNMLSSLAMVVSNKLAEIAVMRTLGVSQGTIMRIFIIEGALSGILGSVFGLGLGLLCLNYLDSILSMLNLNLAISAGGTGVPVLIRGGQLFLIVLVTIALSFAITIYPSIKAAKQSPVESLRYE